MNHPLASVAAAFAILGSGAVLAQAPKADARHIANILYCLSHDRIVRLPLRKGEMIKVHYARDDRSYPDEPQLLVVLPAKGKASALYQMGLNGKPVRQYVLRNNATWRFQHGNIDEIDPPLGGIWTHERLGRNFDKAMRRRSIRMAMSSGRGIRCRSLT